MAFKDLVAYLVIKICIKSKLPKIGLMKIKNQKGPTATKMSLKGETKNSTQITKRN